MTMRRFIPDRNSVNFRRIGILIGFVALAAIGLGLASYWKQKATVLVDGAPVVEAVQAFCVDRANKGLPLPTSVSLRQLMDAGFISSTFAQASGMDGLQVWLNADETRAGSILCSVQMPNGMVAVGLADGSAHLVNAAQMASYRFRIQMPSKREP